MKKILLILLILNTAMPAKFIRQGETIVDTKRGLQWSNIFCGLNRNWKNAIEHCHNLKRSGHSDWRVPTIRELKTLINHRTTPHIYSIFKPRRERECKLDKWMGYWSSNSASAKLRASATSYYDAWYVNFRDAHVGAYSKRTRRGVMCVRKSY